MFLFKVKYLFSKYVPIFKKVFSNYFQVFKLLFLKYFHIFKLLFLKHFHAFTLLFFKYFHIFKKVFFEFVVIFKEVWFWEFFFEAFKVYIQILFYLLKAIFFILKPHFIPFTKFLIKSFFIFLSYFLQFLDRILKSLFIILYRILKAIFKVIFKVILYYLKVFFYFAKDYLKVFFSILKGDLKEFLKEHATVLFLLVLILILTCIYILSVFLGPYYILKFIFQCIWEFLSINDFYPYPRRYRFIDRYFFRPPHSIDIEFFDIAFLFVWPFIGYISYKLRESIKGYYYFAVDDLLKLREENSKSYHIPDLYRPTVICIYTLLLWHFLFFRHLF